MTFGIPDITDGEQSTGFAPQNVHIWALEEDIQWNFYLSCRLQADGLIRRHNELLKELLFKLKNVQWSPGWLSPLPQASIKLHLYSLGTYAPYNETQVPQYTLLAIKGDTSKL